MKKIIIFLVTLIITTQSIFADNTVNISVSENNVNIGDNFTLSININTDSQRNVEVLEIGGINNFENKSQHQTKQVQIINGEVNSIQTLNIGLLSNNSGSYVLGPVIVKIGEEVIQSQSLQVILKDISIPTLTETDINSKLSEDNLPKNNKILNTNYKNNTLENHEDNSNFINNLTDIHSVKKLDLNLKLFKYNGVIYLIIVISIIGFIYLILLKFLNYKKQINKTKKAKADDTEKRKQEIKNIYNELMLLSDKAEEYSQEEYYAELNNLFRRFFLYIGITKADKKTLRELKNDTVDKKILDIFTISYIYEFSTKKDTLSERKQIVMNFMIFLKK